MPIPNVPPLSTIMDDYWDLLPIYQPSISDLDTNLDIKRVLFATHPSNPPGLVSWLLVPSPV